MMIQRVVRRVRSLEGQRLEGMLLELARSRFHHTPLRDREVRHLRAILTNRSLLVSSIEELLRLSPLLHEIPAWVREARQQARPRSPWKAASPLRRVLQAPDAMKRLGGKCPFEL